MKLSKITRKLRLEKNLTIEQLHELSGVKKSTISEIENDKVDPKWSTLKKLFKILEINLNY